MTPHTFSYRKKTYGRECKLVMVGTFFLVIILSIQVTNLRKHSGMMQLKFHASGHLKNFSTEKKKIIK